MENGFRRPPFFDAVISPFVQRETIGMAISNTNKWMVNQSDFLLCYVKHNSESKCDMLEYAKSKKHITIINLADSDTNLLP